jgi:nucleotide-binding universal stress UspA family protein
MYDDVLVGVDGSEPAAVAYERALALAVDHGAVLHVLYVADTNRDSVTTISGQVVDALESEGEAVLEEFEDRAAETSVQQETAVMQGDPAETVDEYARQEDVDLIVLGKSGKRSVERVLLGSVTERVVRSTPVPTLTVQGDDDQGRYPFEVVLAATDGSDAADAAVEHAARLAVAHGAALHVLAVAEPSGLDVGGTDVSDDVRAECESIVADGAAVASEAGVETTVEAVESGTPHRVVREYADEHDADVVAIGAHGRRGFEDRLLGGTTEKVLRTVSLPVLTTRGGD